MPKFKLSAIPRVLLEVASLGAFITCAEYFTRTLNAELKLVQELAFYWCAIYFTAAVALLGGARVINLLEHIEMNTRPTKPAAPLTLEESIARNARDRVGR